MTLVKTIVAALVMWLFALIAPYFTSFGLTAEVVTQLSLALQALLVLLITSIGAFLGKRTGLTEPAALFVAAVEADLPNAANPVKKAEAVNRLNDWIETTVNNPVWKLVLTWGAGAAIENALPMAKTLLAMPPVVK